MELQLSWIPAGRKRKKKTNYFDFSHPHRLCCGNPGWSRQSVNLISLLPQARDPSTNHSPSQSLQQSSQNKIWVEWCSLTPSEVYLLKQVLLAADKPWRGCGFPAWQFSNMAANFFGQKVNGVCGENADWVIFGLHYPMTDGVLLLIGGCGHGLTGGTDLKLMFNSNHSLHLAPTSGSFILSTICSDLSKALQPWNPKFFGEQGFFCLHNSR